MWTHGSSEPEIVDFDLDSFVQPQGYIAELAKKVAVLFLDENIQYLFWMKRSLGLWPDLEEVGSLKQLILEWFTMLCFRLRLRWSDFLSWAFELNFLTFTDFEPPIGAFFAFQNQDQPGVFTFWTCFCIFLEYSSLTDKQYCGMIYAMWLHYTNWTALLVLIISEATSRWNKFDTVSQRHSEALAVLTSATSQRRVDAASPPCHVRSQRTL